MPGPQIECPASPSDTGAYRIAWDGPAGATFRLVETAASAAQPQQQIIYEGPDHASTVSGRPEGTYRYEVGLVEAQQVSVWSEPCDVVVDAPSLQTAFAFFGVGLAVVLATIVTIVRGHRAHRRGEIG